MENEKIKTLPLYAAEDLKKVNFFKILVKYPFFSQIKIVTKLQK